MDAECVELLIIEERFQLEKRGVVIVPDFPIVRGWKNFSENVLIELPDGQLEEMLADFSTAIFEPADMNSLDTGRYWRIVITLPNATKDRVPIGSKVFVSYAAMKRILGAPTPPIPRPPDPV